MAPEQAAADPATDHRADLYAWGVLAYELLAGQHPFAGKTTPQQLLAAHMAEVPRALASTGPLGSGVPPSARRARDAVPRERSGRAPRVRRRASRGARRECLVGRAPLADGAATLGRHCRGHSHRRCRGWGIRVGNEAERARRR